MRTPTIANAVLACLWLSTALPHSVHHFEQQHSSIFEFESSLRSFLSQKLVAETQCEFPIFSQSVCHHQFGQLRTVLRGGENERQNESTRPFVRIISSLSGIKHIFTSSVQKFTSFFSRKSEDKVVNFRSCTVTQANFDTACAEIESLLPTCSFFSIDCEMTSLDPSDWHPSLQVVSFWRRARELGREGPGLFHIAVCISLCILPSPRFCCILGTAAVLNPPSPSRLSTTRQRIATTRCGESCRAIR